MGLKEMGRMNIQREEAKNRLDGLGWKNIHFSRLHDTERLLVKRIELKLLVGALAYLKVVFFFFF